MLDDSWVVVGTLEAEAEGPATTEGETDWTGQEWSKYV